MSKSDLEITFALQLRSLGVPEPEREHQFAVEPIDLVGDEDVPF